MFKNATNKNIIGFLTKNENVPINSCIPDVNISVGEIPIKIHNKKAKKPAIILITPLRGENILFICEESSFSLGP
ncbi:hypothetical protein MSWAN_1113 [Methanobacterium paludis]|uniref:Uncharacterized protein n=1 Tax=Methanobacterium paludis (strain DSM 25820 / JCM 18151 / SWAN1) TaxID=868131 RepID=F6D4S3_METPW|nr:hypothetical protein MSWAN_1113 [Methanobacterium paludis]